MQVPKLPILVQISDFWANHSVAPCAGSEATIRWRLQQDSTWQGRFIHLGDNQSSLATLAKGRSSHQQLNRILQKVACLLMVADAWAGWGYCTTDSNPADAGSRGLMAPKLRASSQHAPSSSCVLSVAVLVVSVIM